MMKDKPPFADKNDVSVKEDHDTEAHEGLLSLLLRAREGSGEALQKLRQRYRPLIDASVSRYAYDYLNLQDVADLQEEADRVFLSAISTYDTEQTGVDFGLYAKICLRNGLVSEMRRLSARRRLGIVPLEDQELPQEADPSADMVETEQFQKLYQTIRRNLSDFENLVWWHYVSGVSVKEIAVKVEKDERSVHNAIYRIRKKLRSLLSQERKT